MQRRACAKHKLLSGEARMRRQLSCQSKIREIMFSRCGTRVAVVTDEQVVMYSLHDMGFIWSKHVSHIEQSFCELTGGRLPYGPASSTQAWHHGPDSITAFTTGSYESNKAKFLHLFQFDSLTGATSKDSVADLTNAGLVSCENLSIGTDNVVFSHQGNLVAALVYQQRMGFLSIVVLDVCTCAVRMPLHYEGDTVDVLRASAKWRPSIVFSWDDNMLAAAGQIVHLQSHRLVRFTDVKHLSADFPSVAFDRTGELLAFTCMVGPPTSLIFH